MNNPRLEGIVKKFATNLNLKCEFANSYEYFVNYILLKKFYNATQGIYPYESALDYDLLESINFGRNNTMAIDGLYTR